MHEQEYTVTLLSDVVVTANAATVGGHEGLDYLPGSLFLGAAAGCALRSGEGFDPSFFLSGRIRFLDACPELGGEATFPFPLSFHQIKGENKWAGQKPLNLLTEAPPKSGTQAEQCRRDYLRPDGKVFKLKKESRMKTAIDRANRRSAEGLLFGYQSIPAGAAYRLKVQADDEGDLRKVDAWFRNRTLRLGRSRSAEYGSVKLVPAKTAGRKTEQKAMGNLVFIYLQTDLALFRQGMPVLLPAGEDFFLPGAGLIAEKTFLRTRRYSPWNAYFNCRMPERQVLCRGSVIAFDAGASTDAAALQARLAGGIGLHREEGLGQVLVNPSWLMEAPALNETGNECEKDADCPDTLLTCYLRDKTRMREESASAFREGLAWAAEWAKLSRRIEKDGQKVPGKTQWANIRELAVRFRGQSDRFRHELQAFCGEDLRRKLWVEASVFVQGKRACLLEAIQDKLRDPLNSRTLLAVYHAAVEMGRSLARSKGNHGEQRS